MFLREKNNEGGIKLNIMGIKSHSEQASEKRRKNKVDPCNKYSMIQNLKCITGIHSSNHLQVLSFKKEKKIATQGNLIGFLM